MLKTFGIAALLVSALALTSGPAAALQTSVTEIVKNPDGTMTYHFVIKTDPGETLAPAAPNRPADFVTIYNFYGFVEGSEKSPASWVFSSEEFGRTPVANGYPMVLPLDVPNTPNLTWTVGAVVAPGTEVAGFTATTKVGTMVEGQYSAQVTRQAVAVKGGPAAHATRQALLGAITTPTFLAEVK